jgi:glycosyltransferase involved in cell wall biosynthesis
LADDDIVLTGFVSDEDLVKLYNLCKAFVFPSLHEGFGLPALEAMQIGRAVIASNTSSLPEVVGRADALFDPRDEASITAQMLRVLSDSSYRQDLEQHGPVQAENFSWDATAKRAIDALEYLLERRGDPMPSLTRKKGKKPRLAFVSPLPPAQSGIADYAAALMQVLTIHYEIVAITEQSEVSDPWITANIPVQNSAWLRRHAREFERVLYHFGNSDFHEHMFDLLQVVPGTVVLHDFFLSGVLNYMGQEFWTSYMLKSHGFDGLYETRDSEGRQRAILTYPANLPVLQNAVGVIVHSDWSKQLAQHWYGAGAASTWVAVPFLRKLPDVNPGLRLEARRRFGFGDDDFIVCSFGLVAETKQSIEILEAFASLDDVARRGAKLVFIGNCGGPYGERLRRARRDLALEKFVDITGVVAPVEYNNYLLAADMCVQLRTQSRGETSAAVFDCLAYGLPTIINANGAMAEIDPDAAYIIPDQFSAHELAYALSHLIGSAELRKRIGSKARLLVQEHHNPETCALKYRDALEGFHSLASDTILKIPDLLASIDMKGLDDRSLAISLAANFPPWPRKPTLFVDVSAITEIDLLTDVQKVARAISKALISVTGTPFTVLPVRETKYGEYVLASRYAEQFVTFPAVHDVLEEPIEPAPGDVFLGLDLNPIRGQRSLEELKRLHRKGIKVFNVVHDLLPIQQLGHLNNPGQFEKWLSNILSFDGAICISQAIAIELKDQISAQAQRRTPSFSVDWFPLGSDIAASAPSDRNRKPTWEESARELLRIVEIRSSDAPSARSSARLLA